MMDSLHRTDKKNAQAGQGFGHTNSDQMSVPNQPQSGKELSTLLAQLALAGHAVHRLADGGYLCSKWGYTYQAADLGDLKAFAKRLGVIGGPLQ